MKFLPVILSLIIVVSSYSGEAFRNFSSCISVQDIEIIGDTVWVATSGGLYKLSKTTGKGILLPNTSSVPDPLYTTLFYEKDKNLWSATYQGYIAKQTYSGGQSVYYNYVSAGWPVTDVVSYGNYLIVGSLKGISFFDKTRENAIKSASKFNTLSTSIVNTLVIHNKILYVGTDQGTAKLNLSNNLDMINLYDPGIWNIDSTVNAVHSFLIINDSVKIYKEKTAIFKSRILRSYNNILYYNGNEVFRFPSNITAIRAGENECWIGTKENYFYRWNESGVTHYKINGMTSTHINKIYVDHASNVWLIPRAFGDATPWWRNIMSLQNNEWKLYNVNNYPDMGVFGEDPEFMGITESRHPGDDKNRWRMWFGSSGGGLKCFFSDQNKWKNYHVLKKEGEATFFRSRHKVAFTKIDAVVQDSSGFIWMSYWMSNSYTNYHNALLCYDPRYEPDSTQANPQNAHYRWFFRNGNENHAGNYTALTVDVNGNIIAGSEDGKVIVFSHRGNPIADSVMVKHNFEYGKTEFVDETERIGKVYDMVSTADGVTRILTAKGIYRFEIDSNALNKEEFGTNVKAIEAENESILWLAVSNEGLVRYDLDSDERTVFGAAQGLISTNFTDMAIDRTNGFVWVATENGVSRLSIGYRLEKNPVTEVLVYPNPLSKKQHSMIYFKNIPFGYRVDIYSTNGKRIGSAKVNRESSQGVYCTWTPNSKTAPGTYFYSIHGNGKAISGKFIITP